MKNLWQNIDLTDYENHMRLDSVRQLQALNHIMQIQFNRYKVNSVMILGVAGGNGLEHIKETAFTKVYGVDINADYLEMCRRRYPEIKDRVNFIEADLMDETLSLPAVDLVIANLLIEYIGYKTFQEVIIHIKPQYVSCVIQINTDENFISESPYLKRFEGLNKVHHQMSINGLNEHMHQLDYRLIDEEEFVLPNGKRLVRLDYLGCTCSKQIGEQTEIFLNEKFNNQ